MVVLSHTPPGLQPHSNGGLDATQQVESLPWIGHNLGGFTFGRVRNGATVKGNGRGWSKH